MAFRLSKTQKRPYTTLCRDTLREHFWYKVLLGVQVPLKHTQNGIMSAVFASRLDKTCTKRVFCCISSHPARNISGVRLALFALCLDKVEFPLTLSPRKQRKWHKLCVSWRLASARRRNNACQTICRGPLERDNWYKVVFALFLQILSYIGSKHKTLYMIK